MHKNALWLGLCGGPLCSSYTVLPRPQAGLMETRFRDLVLESYPPLEMMIEMMIDRSFDRWIGNCWNKTF